MKALFIGISAAALLAASPVYASCNFGNPHDCIGPTGPQGPAGIDGKDGRDGVDGTNGIDGKDGRDGIDGKNGVDGKDGLNGKDGRDGVNGLNGRDGRNFDSDDTLALSAALSPPVWLGDKETVRVSVGTGFNEGAAAVGAAGVVRIDGGLAGFVGGAVSTETGAWAGKAGISLGW
jgi:hypothetical protein